MAGSKFNLVSESLELTDPNPDIHQLFVDFNAMFFENKLGSVEVKWSPRMTLCAGLCRYMGRNGQCSIHLSKPLLTLRPRRDLIETLLHEMIHAYLFVVDRNKERESHGPKFISIMTSINQKTGTNITVFHSFHDEVSHYKVHWWQCDGPCKTQPPFYGLVKRSMNRAPGPNDTWYSDHKRKCNGSFKKIREPQKSQSVPKTSRKRKATQISNGSHKKISDIFPKSDKAPKKKVKTNSDVPITPISEVQKQPDQPPKPIGDPPPSGPKFDSPKKQVNFYGIIPFSGKGNTVGGGGAKPTQGMHPLLLKLQQTKISSDKDVPADNKVPLSAEPIQAGPSKAEKGGQARIKKEVEDVILLSSDDDTISIHSMDEMPSVDLCPACGIEYKDFLQTLDEHLQVCDMLADW